MTARKKGPTAPQEGKQDLNPFAGMELRSITDYLKMIQERWIIALSASLLVVCLVGFFLLRAPRIYEARATLLLEPRSERVVDMERVVETGLEGAGSSYTTLLQTQMEQIRSRSFREYVVSSFSEREVERIVAPYVSEDPAAPKPKPIGILGGVSVENPRSTYLLRIGFRHRDPEVAAMVADRFAEQYIRFAMERSQSGNDFAIGFLKEQSEELRERVEEAEQALQKYRQKHNLVSVEENQNIIVERLKSISSALTSARVARLALEDQVAQVEAFRDEDRRLLEIGVISEFGSVRTLLDERDRLRNERDVMGEKYGRRHPQMIQNERSIEATERTLQENIDLAVADLQSKLASARQNEDSLRKELTEAEQDSLKLDQLAIDYQVLRRNADSARATFSQIIHRLNEAAITSQLDSTNIKISDRAVVPGSPVEPDVRRVILMVAFLGGFVFVGLPIGLEFIDNKVKTAWDVERFLGQQLAGELPSLKKMAPEDRGHIVEREVDEQATEAFRGLFSQLELTTEVDYPKIIAVTSTLPGEGKSFVSSNLAYCFAAHGKKTLIVDCDFRRPVLHGMYKLDNSEGILAALAEGGSLTSDSPALGIREVAENLSLLRAGGHTRKATERIKTPGVEGFFAALRERYDVVIIDTPPVGVFPDALSIAAMSDEVLYVVRHGKIARQQAKSFINRLEETDALFAGVVMNAMPQGKSARYGYYGYYGNYKYEKYYAEQS